MPYDQLASGAIIYAYVGGNPVNFTDPRGLNPAAAARTGWIIGGGINTLVEMGTGLTVGSLIYNAVNGNGEAENTEPKARQKGDGMTSSDDPLQQLEEIEKAQQAVREGKSKKRIDCIDKSKQRAKNYLKGLTAEDAADSDEDCGCD